MNLLEQSVWWLVPFALLMLWMVHAMMEFTVSLLVQRPPAKRTPVAADELRRRLLAADEGDQLCRLVAGKDCDLEIYWETREAPQPSRRAIARGASAGHLRLLLDEQRHEVRINEVTRSYYWFVGLSGWVPRIAAYAGAAAGPPGQAITREISRVAGQGGWTVRPVLWWFQATKRGHRFLETATPAPLRQWPARRLWGILYPLSYVLGIGYLLAIVGPLDGQDVLMIVGISAVWWGIWGFLVWVLLGFPAFWRDRRR